MGRRLDHARERSRPQDRRSIAMAKVENWTEWLSYPCLYNKVFQLRAADSPTAPWETSMPIFEYRCEGCGHKFEAILFGEQKPECPKCHTHELEQQLSVFAVSAKGSSASAAPTGACGSCGDPRGPGACSMRDMN